jgi:hypothetical protein
MDLSAIFYIATATVLAVGLFYFLSTGQGHATDKSKSDAPKPGESQFHRDVRKRIGSQHRNSCRSLFHFWSR